MVTVLFIIVSGYLLLNAFGYKINWQSKSFQKTGIISIKVDPKSAKVLINNKIITKNSPIVIKRVLPGYYNIEVQNDGYRTWSRRIQVNPGLVTNLDWLVLFKKDPKVENANLDDQNELFNSLPEKDLVVDGSEIYRIVDGIPILVTRILQEVKAVRFYPGHYFLAYQAGNEVEISELDGQGVFEVFKLKSDQPIKLIFKDEGKILLILQEENIYKISIR